MVHNLIFNMFLDEMMMNVNVLGSTMLNEILRNINSTQVVAV